MCVAMRILGAKVAATHHCTTTNNAKGATVDLDEDAPLSSTPLRSINRREETHSSSAFERQVVRQLANIMTVVENMDRRLSTICVQRGINIDLPVTLPMANKEHLESLEDWLHDDVNAKNLVSHF